MICYSRGAIYAGMRLGRSKVTLVFYLDHLAEAPPVTRTFDASRNRIAHEAVLQSDDDVTELLKMSLAQSYELLG